MPLCLAASTPTGSGGLLGPRGGLLGPRGGLLGPRGGLLGPSGGLLGPRGICNRVNVNIQVNILIR